MKQKLVLALLASAALSACSSDAADPIRPQLNPEAKMIQAADPADVIPGRFIVTLRDDASGAAVAAEHGVQADFVYSRLFKGFAGSIGEMARSGLLRDARVVRIEPDGIARAVTTVTGATWGLDRIDQARGLDGTYTYNADGSGVTAYIIDTGIDVSNADFGGRASVGTDKVGDGRNGIDCNGHGTHVAGTVGGAKWGVAKNVTLVAVRVLNCSGSGSWSGVAAGMDWVAGAHAAGTPAVANMSLGGGANTTVDDAVRRMIADGVATAVAAGNGNFVGIAQDACKSSPARVAEAMTIGAADKTDRKASWSNYGNCVDWFAPGVGITSDWIVDSSHPDATNTISGTSMATPHTAGVAALYLQGNPTASAAAVRDALFTLTTKNVVTSAKTVNNHLLFTNF